MDQIDFQQGVHRIAVTVDRPARGSSQSGVVQPVVKLSVTGPDRDWVDLAKLRMSERLGQGSRSTGKIKTALLVCGFLALCLALGIGLTFGDEQKGLNAAELVGIVLGIATGVLLLLYASLDTITPQLELLPEEGVTRWNRLKQRLNFTSRWLGDTVVKAAIGAVIVIAIQRLLL